MKKFLKKTEGFTLVELIVVIAILGILTAIAVPAYSGYVKKASEAGDTQTLSAVNTAIAAAITENNKVMADADDYLTFTAVAGSKGCTVTVAKTSDAAAQAVLDDFKTYYGLAAAENTFTFDYYKSVRYATASDENVQLGNLVGVQP